MGSSFPLVIYPPLIGRVNTNSLKYVKKKKKKNIIIYILKLVLFEGFNHSPCVHGLGLSAEVLKMREAFLRSG